MKILTEKQKVEAGIQILDALKSGQIDEAEGLEQLEKLGSDEFGSNVGQFLRDGLSIARSLALRPVSERTAEPLLTHALSGLRSRAKSFLTAEPADVE